MRKAEMRQFKEREFKQHPLHWVVESLWDEVSYLEKSMFGCRGCYLHGRLVLVLAYRDEEPWRGLLVPTEKAFHKSLLQGFPGLVVHPVLGKWLYLQEASEEFEETAQRLVDGISRDDPRIGVVPKPRKRKTGPACACVLRR
jgi:hypothetical protein